MKVIQNNDKYTTTTNDQQKNAVNILNVNLNKNEQKSNLAWEFENQSKHLEYVCKDTLQSGAWNETVRNGVSGVKNVV